MKKYKYVVVFVTTPTNNVDNIVNHLVNKNLVACVNIVDKITSVYWWEGKVCKDKEVLLIMKTKFSLIKQLIKEIKNVHPYKVPEIIFLPIIEGNKDYLDWVEETVRKFYK